MRQTTTLCASNESLDASPALSTSPSQRSRLKVSALICTRDRGDLVETAVRSILHKESPCAELIVVDQSSDDRSRTALAPYSVDPRFRYISSSTRGKGLALNLGLTLAQSEIVAITDDDCEVSSDWPKYHVEAMERHPRVAISYGSVIAGEHDPALGFIPAYTVTHDRLCRNVLQKLPARGIGANTAVRRDAVLALGGFDPETGPGGLFRACIDRDMTMRCLLAGHYVFESHDSNVYHFGFRTWEQGRKLTYDAWYGLGASCVKPLRVGRLGALPVGIYEFVWNALAPFVFNTLRGKRPAGWLRIVGFCAGMIAGLRMPIDRRTIRFATERSSSTTAPD